MVDQAASGSRDLRRLSISCGVKFQKWPHGMANTRTSPFFTPAMVVRFYAPVIIGSLVSSQYAETAQLSIPTIKVQVEPRDYGFPALHSHDREIVEQWPSEGMGLSTTMAKNNIRLHYSEPWPWKKSMEDICNLR
jgi:heme A synthase